MPNIPKQLLKLLNLKNLEIFKRMFANIFNYIANVSYLSVQGYDEILS